MMAFVYIACTVHVTIFSTGGKFRPVSNCTELQALAQATALVLSDKQVGVFLALWLQCVQVSRPKALLVPGENCELPAEETH